MSPPYLYSFYIQLYVFYIFIIHQSNTNFKSGNYFREILVLIYTFINW